VKKQLVDEGGYSSLTLSEMDTTFMATYAIGSFVSGRLGDIYRPTTVLAIGLYGSGICLGFMVANLLMDYEHMSKLLGDSIMLGTYFLFGFAQSTGGPVGTGEKRNKK
jgi:OPA family glycerol-3-phosphate transporter-like MFS transporter 1/2